MGVVETRTRNYKAVERTSGVRLVDCYIDTLLYTRRFYRGLFSSHPAIDTVREQYKRLFEESAQKAASQGFSKEAYERAKYAVVAYVDEVILTSSWTQKEDWQKNPLQRSNYNTTNIGSTFYDKLNELNKFGPDRDVLEVYSLCLGLGFKGKYHSGDGRQKYEEIKGFNLSVLLPEEAQRNIDTATLFPTAYGDTVYRGKGDYKPRINLMPYIIAIPTAIILAMTYYYHQSIVERLDSILSVLT